MGKDINTVLFDFGGVIAEEGFREGLYSIAHRANLPQHQFFSLATQLIYDTGYVIGKATEAQYWQEIRKTCKVDFSDEEMRNEILSRFILRRWMLDYVLFLRNLGHHTSILSDQTQWLTELNTKLDFFKYFDSVFNSYYLGISKRDPETFAIIADQIQTPTEQIVFIDDNEGNVQRAKSTGYEGIYYRNQTQFLTEMKELGI